MKLYKPPLDGRSKYDGLLLDFNERTKPPSRKVMVALGQFIKGQKLQVYPEYFDLEKRIAQYAGVKASQVMLTNGSDQGMDLIFRAFTEKGDKVIIPSPSFAMFFQWAQIVGNEMICPLYKKDDLSFPLEEVLALINEKVKLVVVCNPNNPTGTAASITDIEKIARQAKRAVVYVDEAYFEFSKITAVSLIKKYPNIIITRTFSKAFGLASLRIGYVMAREECLAEMLKIRGPYDVNMAAYFAAAAALQDRKSMESYTDEVMRKAKPLVEKFFTENAIPYFSSCSNFILFRPDHPAKIIKLLAQGGAWLRPQNKPHIGNTLRVSIGTVKQMKKFTEIYKKVGLKKSKRKYALLDRDGTLIFEPPDTGQVDSLKKLKILNGVILGLQALKKRGYALIMVSNQNGLGTASFPQKSFDAPQEKMLKIFRDRGIIFDQIFICPHQPAEECSCRKPKTALVDEFLRQAKVDNNLSFVCGDRKTDQQFAENIGFRFFPMKTNGNFYEAVKPLLNKTV